MKAMFESATIKLTAWYIAILMTISIIFSAIIYQVSVSEISARLERLRDQVSQSSMINISDDYFHTFAAEQSQESTQAIVMGLVYVNIFIFITGSIGCYALARMTLRPVERAHDLQSRFVSNASHELRTPLATIKAENEVALRDKRISKQELRDTIQSNLEEVDRLASLSHVLLQLSSQENNELETAKVVLNKSIKSIVSARQNSSNHKIKLELPKNNIYATINQTAIEEVINILIDNAIKYSDHKQPLAIKLSRSPRNARIFVTNGGPTISSKDIDRIFDRFYRGDSARSAGGYGLGLSLAKQIIDQHKGSISCSSHRNKTTFTINLPL